jgi:cytochrome c553
MVKAPLHVPFLVGLASIALFLGHVNAWASDEADRAARLALPLPADTAEGKSLYKANCFRCHGSNGSGDGDLGIPTLAAQRFRYLVLQLADFSDDRRDSTAMHRTEGHRHNVDKELVRFLQGFGGPDIDGVADYLSRLRGSRNPGPHSRQ